MWRAIGAYAVVGCVIFIGVDRLWPIWPVHVVTIIGAAIVLTLAGLAAVAARKR